MTRSIVSFLYENITGSTASWLVPLLLLAIVVVGAVVAYHIVDFLLLQLLRIIGKTPTRWDDDIINRRLLAAVSQLAPAIWVNNILPDFFANDPRSLRWLTSITALYIVWAAVRIVTITLNNVLKAFQRRPSMRPYAIKGVFQMVNIIIICIGAIIGVSILADRSPMTIITALGASAAVLMLVFKDSILGLVASVQLTANKMLHTGDWIVCDKHGANGTVVDVSLTTVKVRNWDNSITTIPPYSLVSESFRNYQEMVKTGARRIDRAIFIDVNTVRFCTAAELEALAAEGWLEGLETAQAAHMVNLHLLRRYLEAFLARDSRVLHDQIYMVRQLDPTPSGIPLQLYFFTGITEWKAYEGVQADIFDHVYAIINRFGLSVYQTPAGRDISRIRTEL